VKRANRCRTGGRQRISNNRSYIVGPANRHKGPLAAN
jgi:hypothetical protein